VNTRNTNPRWFDTDGDLLPDGWEVQYGLDPKNETGDNGAGGDPDGDGLTNLDELIYDCTPTLQYGGWDTDGDGTSDGDEVDQGSNPNDDSDGGQPSETFVNLKLTVGDPSGSESERYSLKVGPITHQAPAFGQVEERVYAFKMGEKYEITIKHEGTDPDYSSTPHPDYDYVASVELSGEAPDNVAVLIEDDDGILGSHFESDEFYAKGKKAYVTISRVKITEPDGNPASDNHFVFNSASQYIATVSTPDGIRVAKTRSVGSGDYQHKYIVDISGKLPKIILMLDASTENVVKSSVHANNQVIAQHDGGSSASLYFYTHDRLGSARQLFDPADLSIENNYTFDAWGLPIAGETSENIFNPYGFAGYLWDSEISLYHCNARMYDPVLGRFTSRDLVTGTFHEPMSLHKYLYCQNDPINRIDPMGLYSYSWEETQELIEEATQFVSEYGPWAAFGRWGQDGVGRYDFKIRQPSDIFNIGGERLLASEFGNYLAGYTTFYNYRALGIFGSWVMGHYYGIGEWAGYRLGVSETYVRWAQDDVGSQYWQARGAWQANRDEYRGLGAQLDSIVIGAAVWNLNILRHIDYFQYSEDAFTWEDLNIWD
jgi:RHS repeat-associated protein